MAAHLSRAPLGARLTGVVVEALRQQRDLASVLSLDESLHHASHESRCSNLANDGFSHNLGQKRTVATGCFETQVHEPICADPRFA